jgi:hypothetical protein
LTIAKQIVDDKCAIVMELQFTLHIRKTNDPKEEPETKHMILAWGLYMPEYLNGVLEEKQVRTVMLTGYGQSASGQMLWALPELSDTALNVEVWVTRDEAFVPPQAYGDQETEETKVAKKVPVKPQEKLEVVDAPMATTAQPEEAKATTEQPVPETTVPAATPPVEQP